jgi:hypothetical protein
MKIHLNKPIYGIRNGTESKILHADKGDILTVILHNPTHFICDSKYYPNTHIVVFKSQCDEIIKEVDIEDTLSPERYYHVLEDSSKSNLDDPFYTELYPDDE